MHSWENRGLMSVEARIGPIIRKLRQAKGLTLVALADLSGLSVSHLSQTERGITSPSLSALRRIADALDIRLSQLMLAAEPVSLGADRFVSRQEDRVSALLLGTNIDYQLITREGSDMQLLWIVAPPGECMERHARRSPGEECGFVISGEMRVVIDGSEAILEPGDAVFIESLLEHSWESVGPEDLTAIWTITPPLSPNLEPRRSPGTPRDDREI